MNDAMEPAVERVYLLARRHSTNELTWMCLPVVARDGDRLHIGGAIASIDALLADSWNQVPAQHQLRDPITTCSRLELLRDMVVVSRSVEDDVFLLCLECHPIGTTDQDRLLVEHAYRFGNPGTIPA